MVARTLFQQGCEGALDPEEGVQPGAYVEQVSRGKPRGGATPHPVIELQKLADFIETESEPLGRLDEPYPRRVRIPVVADTTRGSPRRRDQLPALIEADRFDIDTRGFRQLSDRHAVCIGHHWR